MVAEPHLRGSVEHLVRKLGPWLAVCVVLVLANAPLHRFAIATYVRPQYEFPIFPLQERTFGLNPLYVFDILDATRRPDSKLFFLIGDSSVGTGMTQPLTMLGTHLEQLLRSEYGDDARLVVLSYPGLLVEDALLFMVQALARDPALVYYAVNPRIFANTSGESQHELGLSGRAGGLALAGRGYRGLPWSYLPERFSFEKLAASFVASRLHFVSDASGVRLTIRRSCEGRSAVRLSPSVQYACDRVFPRADYAPPPPQPRQRQYVYTNDEYSFEPGPTEAFRLMLDLCERSGRCAMYRTPLNLRDPGCKRYFEPGLLDRYEGYLSAVGFTDERAIDHANALAPDQFMNERAGGCDVLHPDDEGRRILARTLLEDARKLVAEGR